MSTIATRLPETQVVAAPHTENDPVEPATDILGVRISALDMPTAVQIIEEWIEADAREYVCVCAVHVVMEARRNPDFMKVVNTAGLRTPDGMPLVWLSRLRGNCQVRRVCGPDLMNEVCARSALTGHSHFFYGGDPGVSEELVARLREWHPGLNVAGVYTPGHFPIGGVEDPAVIEAINVSGADIVWVGLGCPKQEWWIAKHRALLDAPVLIGVGAAFDFHSGRIRRAPGWMQRGGLEWLYRLSQDPGRLWKRYAIYNMSFAKALANDLVRGNLLRRDSLFDAAATDKVNTKATDSTTAS